MTELLKQPASSPFSTDREVVSIWAGTTGKLDDIDVADIRPFEKAFLDYIAHNQSGIFDAINETGQLSEDTVGQLEKAVAEVKSNWQAEKDSARANTGDTGSQGQPVERADLAAGRRCR